MSTFKYFMKTERPQVVFCMRYAQPAVASVKGRATAREQHWCEGSPSQEARGTKTTQVNARMATADHDRQGQAAQTVQITHSS